jgi:hypothetical protein
MLQRRNIQVNEEPAQNILRVPGTARNRQSSSGPTLSEEPVGSPAECQPLDVISYLDVPEEKLIFKQTFLYGAFTMAAWNILRKERSAPNIDIVNLL